MSHMSELSGSATPPRQRTVLFLISDTGAGHRSAANAIAEAMRALGEPNWRAVIVDGVRECGRFPFRSGVFLYGPATKYSPRLFGHFFHLTNAPARVRAARRVCAPFLRQGLRNLIQRTRPDVIVSAHPFFNQVVPPLLADLGARVPLVSVVTDLFTVHHCWVAAGVDAWVAPTETARRFLIAGGVPARRIQVLGLPIAPAFAAENDRPRAELRAALGLDPTLPMILLVGGGEGVGGLRATAQALAEVELPAQLVVVTGRNRVLHEELRQARDAFRMPATLLGFVDNMPALMRAADILVSKAGSLTVTEAIASELPILLMGAVPGQEEGNITFVRDEGLGIHAPSPDVLVEHLRGLLAPGDSHLSAMRANAARLKRPLAALDTARLVFSFLPPVTVPSPWECRLLAARITSARQGDALVRRRALAHAPRSLVRGARRASGSLSLGALRAWARRTSGARWPSARHGSSWNANGRHGKSVPVGDSFARLARIRARRPEENARGKVQLRRPGRH